MSSRNHFTAEEFEAFSREAWVTAKKEYDKYSLQSPRYIFPLFEDRAYDFLSERLESEERIALSVVRRAFPDRRRRAWRLMPAMFGLALLGVVWLSLEAHQSGMNLLPMIVASYVGFGMIALSIHAALLSPRVMTALMSAEATVRLFLAIAGLKAIGNDNTARPMRLAALIAFIVGSLLDLVVTW